MFQSWAYNTHYKLAFLASVRDSVKTGLYTPTVYSLKVVAVNSSSLQNLAQIQAHNRYLVNPF